MLHGTRADRPAGEEHGRWGVQPGSAATTETSVPGVTMNNSMRRRDDLRYYMHDGSDAFRFQLAGRLSKDAARDLEQAWRTASSVIGEKRVILDLSDLTSIDASGQELLSRWNCQGALLGAISHQARARLQLMTDQPVTDLANATAGPT